MPLGRLLRIILDLCWPMPWSALIFALIFALVRALSYEGMSPTYEDMSPGTLPTQDGFRSPRGGKKC